MATNGIQCIVEKNLVYDSTKVEDGLQTAAPSPTLFSLPANHEEAEFSKEETSETAQESQKNSKLEAAKNTQMEKSLTSDEEWERMQRDASAESSEDEGSETAEELQKKPDLEASKNIEIEKPLSSDGDSEAKTELKPTVETEQQLPKDPENMEIINLSLSDEESEAETVITDLELPKDPELEAPERPINVDEEWEKLPGWMLAEVECQTEEVRAKRYETLRLFDDLPIAPNLEEMECPICLIIQDSMDGVILKDCLHFFCKSCIAHTIQYCQEAEVKCPFRDNEYACESILQEREIKALVEPHVYQQHLAKSIAQAENNAGRNAFHCKTPDCRGWCYVDANVINFLCPVCENNNCMKCQAIHASDNCEQYQALLTQAREMNPETKKTAAMLSDMVVCGQAMACPTCSVIISRDEGCDGLICSMCKTHICWATKGPRWGPAGQGDMSGGCHCKENGKKCHPNCRNCH